MHLLRLGREAKRATRCASTFALSRGVRCCGRTPLFKCDQCPHG